MWKKCRLSWCVRKKLEVTQPFANNTGEVTAVIKTDRHSVLKKENFKLVRNRRAKMWKRFFYKEHTKRYKK